jgi:hypothetical protein
MFSFHCFILKNRKSKKAHKKKAKKKIQFGPKKAKKELNLRKKQNAPRSGRFLSTKPLVYIVLQFGLTRLHKTHDFGQIQNPLDQDLLRNTTTTGACRLHVVR